LGAGSFVSGCSPTPFLSFPRVPVTTFSLGTRREGPWQRARAGPRQPHVPRYSTTPTAGGPVTRKMAWQAAGMAHPLSGRRGSARAWLRDVTAFGTAQEQAHGGRLAPCQEPG